MKKSIFSFFLLLVGLSILGLFILSLDLSLFKEVISHFPLVVVLFVLFLVYLTILLKAFRWRYLVSKTSGIVISWKFSIISIFAGIAAGSITPGRAGEVAKPFLMKSRYGTKVSETISCVMVERLFDLLSLILLFFIGLLFLPTGLGTYSSATWIIFCLFLILILFFFIFPRLLENLCHSLFGLLVSSKLQSRLSEITTNIFSGLSLLRKSETVLTTGILSLTSMLIEIFRFQIILLVLGLPFSFWTISLSFAASVIFSLITFIPGGIGTTEVSLAAILLSYSPSSDATLLKWAVLTDRIFAYYLLIIIGGLILVIPKLWQQHPQHH